MITAPKMVQIVPFLSLSHSISKLLAVRSLHREPGVAGSEILKFDPCHPPTATTVVAVGAGSG